MTKKNFTILLIIILLSSCQWLKQPENNQEAPVLPDPNEFNVNLEISPVTSRDDSYTNWNNAVKAASYWKEIIDQYKKTFEFLTICANSSPQYFSSNTWYWRIDMDSIVFELFATKFSNTETFIEGYLEKSKLKKPDSLKIISGYYFPDSQNGNFELYNNDDSLIINWTPKYINYSLTHSNYPTNQLITQKLGYATKYEIAFPIYKDTAKININYNKSGKIKFYTFFKDSLWHCWDKELKNCDCDDD